MQFRVPQFIDIEDKILGPLTWKQFAYTLGAVGVLYISLRLSPSRFLGLIIAAPFVGTFLSLAFVKINNQSFVEILEHAFNYFTGSRLYTWQKNNNQNQNQISVIQSAPKDNIEVHTRKDLAEIANDLDIRG
jgi:nicotinamide riboside transporter PnuC